MRELQSSPARWPVSRLSRSLLSSLKCCRNNHPITVSSGNSVYPLPPCDLIPLRHLLLGRCADSYYRTEPATTRNRGYQLAPSPFDRHGGRLSHCQAAGEEAPSGIARSAFDESASFASPSWARFAQISERYTDPFDHQHRPLCPESARQSDASKTAASSRASSRRPSAASVRSQRSWIGKTPATTTNGTTTMASPYEGASQGQGGPLSGAADLLRQAMMSGSQRYVQKTRVFLIIRPVISPCNPANFTCYTHARNPHALLRVFRPPHRHWHGTAPAQHGTTSTITATARANAADGNSCTRDSVEHSQNHRRWQRSVRFAP